MQILNIAGSTQSQNFELRPTYYRQQPRQQPRSVDVELVQPRRVNFRSQFDNLKQVPSINSRRQPRFNTNFRENTPKSIELNFNICIDQLFHISCTLVVYSKQLLQ